MRSGEELDRTKLSQYLATVGFTNEAELVLEQFPAGSSNLTYLVKAGGEEFVLRRPPFGNTVKTAHDMRREFNVLWKLSAVYPPAPKPLVFCDDGSVIGSEFYLMERRRGLIIRGRVGSPTASEGAPNEEQRRSNFARLNTHGYRLEVCRSFVENLADLHSIDYAAAGLGDLGHPEGYARRQVEGWSKRYSFAKTDENVELENAIVWLNENIPADSGASLVHNDYKFDNVMLDPNDLTRITAVLDWEMVTIGDPLMDLGTTLGYWMSADAGEEMLNMPFNPRVLMENISRSDLAEMYASATGRDISNVLYYYVFGTFKVAVIAQQIYARYVRGFTRDERFANFHHFVAALGRIASATISNGKI